MFRNSQNMKPLSRSKSQELRPDPSPRWQTCPRLSQVSLLMHDCWHPKPAIRLTALRVKMSVRAIRGQEDEEDAMIKMIY